MTTWLMIKVSPALPALMSKVPCITPWLIYWPWPGKAALQFLLNCRSLRFGPHCISVYSIMQLVFVMEMDCVFYVVRIEFLEII
jgi:hypothetical protein